MFAILTAEEMKQADAAAIAAGTPGFALMQAAGKAVAQYIQDNVERRNILVLCGAGNNGGDGFIAAGLLKKAGWNVRVACLVKKAALKGDAALAAKTWDGEAESLNSNLSLKDTGLVVDAVFGTGFRGALGPELVTLFDKIRAKRIPAVAVDIPSGIDATACTVAEGALAALATVTFCRKKTAHLLYPSSRQCGDIFVSDIGIANDIVDALHVNVFENHPDLWRAQFPLPRPEMHKFDRGHVLVYGGAQRTGAACLAAHAAQKIGAGLVSIACRPESRVIYSCYRASIMVDAWSDIEEFKSLLRDERRNAFVIGPGAGGDVKAAVEAALAFNKTGVLDGDVFSAYKDNPGELFEKLSPHHVLTPHEGEFERLFGIIEGSKLDRARHAARIAKAVIVLKGADTVIAAPDGRAFINVDAPATLATAGSGDVLAGLIAGLSAQGMDDFMAAAAAVWLHGKSAKIHGFGLTAEDIINHIPQTLNGLFAPARRNP